MKTHFLAAVLASAGLLCGGPAKSNLPKQLPKRQVHAASGRAMSPLRARGPAGPAAPPLSNVRHRSPNPAVMGGSADASKRNAGAIDGRQVHRRP